MTLSCKYCKYNCSRTKWPGVRGWILSTALSQESGMCSPFLTVTETAGVRGGRPGGWRSLWGLRALTWSHWAWPNTYFPGGLVWAGIGPGAARTAAGRFATRQEKSVDSTQFRPSTLPCRMFPSMPVLSFYSLSFSFRCLCDQMGDGEW